MSDNLLPAGRPSVKLAAVVTEPGITFTSLYACVVATLNHIQMPFMSYTSAFWAKGITCAIEDIIKEFDPEYVLCLDFDTVFTADNVKRLTQHMDENPELAAVWPVQVSRHEDKPLCFDPNLDYTTALTKATFGHFGCTLIRTSALKQLPHPWFMDLPNPQTGKWNEEPKSDADITFWRALKHKGFACAQANDVVVGHVELAVRWPHCSGVMLQPIQEYRSSGMPVVAEFCPACWQNERVTYGNPTDNGQS